VIIRFVEIGGIFMCNIYLMHQGNIKQLFDGSASQGQYNTLVFPNSEGKIV
jgi:hypothetical protein